MPFENKKIDELAERISQVETSNEERILEITKLLDGYKEYLEKLKSHNIESIKQWEIENFEEKLQKIRENVETVSGKETTEIEEQKIYDEIDELKVIVWDIQKKIDSNLLELKYRIDQTEKEQELTLLNFLRKVKNKDEVFTEEYILNNYTEVLEIFSLLDVENKKLPKNISPEIEGEIKKYLLNIEDKIEKAENVLKQDYELFLKEIEEKNKYLNDQYITENFDETRQIYASLIEKKKQLKGGRVTLIDNNLKILSQRIKEIEDKKRMDLLTILDEVEKLLPIFTEQYILENPLDSRTVYEKYSKINNSLKGTIDSKIEEKVKNSIDTLLSRIEDVEKREIENLSFVYDRTGRALEKYTEEYIAGNLSEAERTYVALSRDMQRLYPRFSNELSKKIEKNLNDLYLRVKNVEAIKKRELENFLENSYKALEEFDYSKINTDLESARQMYHKLLEEKKKLPADLEIVIESNLSEIQEKVIKTEEAKIKILEDFLQKTISILEKYPKEHIDANIKEAVVLYNSLRREQKNLPVGIDYELEKAININLNAFDNRIKEIEDGKKGYVDEFIEYLNKKIGEFTEEKILDNIIKAKEEFQKLLKDKEDIIVFANSEQEIEIERKIEKISAKLKDVQEDELQKIDILLRRAQTFDIKFDQGYINSNLFEVRDLYRDLMKTRNEILSIIAEDKRDDIDQILARLKKRVEHAEIVKEEELQYFIRKIKGLLERYSFAQVLRNPAEAKDEYQTLIKEKQGLLMEYDEQLRLEIEALMSEFSNRIKDAEKEIVQSKIDKIVNKIGGFITRYSYVEPSDKELVMGMIGEYKDIVANYKQFENELDMKSQELLKERIQQCQNLIKQIDYEIQYERDIIEIKEGCTEFIKMYRDKEVLLSKIWEAQNKYNALLQKFESIPFHKDSATEHEIVKKLQICYGLIDKSFKGL
ncbi:MAG: hypothetical protein APG12_00166 [Candidatus Methanofastidiosum methylothiophilum]|uniref:Uncharacterized protein n=1 Tax=Candidatus Methanofastidiosum methylothiophilum TaxID=1705564 RepID=A0A150IMQ3_9EURY|nr:MAG: hypothetical protein APG10_00113 [Candidatus Methanofastidiosum methylthiophilus]KYC48589.1 MAG: hypothetical protein APG11_00260 [Candidatus Methanofastidiosum methylthiophilus]KYC51241.1 MAG: hypothetical protein APG12_00166 [Candidatus Methanofastidiosum methylthiophilus]